MLPSLSTKVERGWVPFFNRRPGEGKREDENYIFYKPAERLILICIRTETLEK
jgi:hypothetical protein